LRRRNVGARRGSIKLESDRRGAPVERDNRMQEHERPQSDSTPAMTLGDPSPRPAPSAAPVQIGGREGPDPPRNGDWEKNGRCIDF
jgi:hypothetical protein